MNRPDGLVCLEHGAGGALSRELVEEIIYPELRNHLYSDLDDATRFQGTGAMLMTTDTFTIDPLFFPGGNIGSLAVYGTCNDLAVSGGTPLYLSAGFVLEEGLPLTDLQAAVSSMAKALEETGARTITGDTKVVPRGRGGGIYINTCGIGSYVDTPGLDLSPRRIAGGDVIIVSGPLGSHGAAVLAAREGLPGGENIRSDAAYLGPLCRMLIGLGGKLKFMRDATRGGAAAVLNEIVAGIKNEKNLGIVAKEDAFPILGPVQSFTALLGLNPLEIANEGVLIAVVEESAADEALSLLQKTDLGKQAAAVGTVTDEFPGKVVLSTAIGGTRILGNPRGLLLPRIC